MSEPEPRPPFKLKPFIPYEQDIQKAILSFLRYDYRVAWAERFNSGAAVLPCGGGKKRPIRFNTLDGCPDILGQMKDGRILAIEVKRPPWRKPQDTREMDQERFLNKVNTFRGIGFFATSVADVQNKLAMWT